MTNDLQKPAPQADNPDESDATTAKVARQRSLLWLTPLIAFGVVVALIGIDVAAVSASQNAPARPVVNVVHVSGSAAITPVVYLTVSPGLKPGPDGQLHDAFSVTNFYVKAGQPIKLVINNTDTAEHSITAMGAGVNIVVKPGTHTYTLLVKHQGRFEWMCTYPCDPYSMAHIGYMRGYITSV
jgi:plastocyanin